jgi:hypothetical protein
LYAEAKLDTGRIIAISHNVRKSRVAKDLGDDLIAKVVYTARVNPPKAMGT